MIRAIIVLIVLSSVSLFSQVFRGQMLPENCEFVKSRLVQLVRQDSKNRVWVYALGGGQNLMLRENGVWRSVYKNLNGPGDFLEDKYGNILIATSQNLFVYKNDGTIQIVNEGSLNYLRQLCIVDTCIYFSNIALGTNIIPEVGYDKSSNSYRFVRTIFLHDSLPLLSAYGVVEKNKELYYVCEKGLMVYNIANQTYRVIRHPELDIFTLHYTSQYDVPDAGGMYIDNKGVISILTTKDKKPAVMRIYSDDSIKTFIYPYFISPAVFSGKEGIDSRLFPVNNEQSEFLFSANKDLLYFSEKTGIMYIPRPVEITENDWFSMYDMSIVDGDELWCGTFLGGILRLGLKELLATKTEQPPAGVEDIVPYIAMMDIYSVYPQPGSQYVDIDYFLQTCNFSENKIKIYDTYGQEVTKFKFEVLRDKGMMRTLRINTEGFSSGGYVVEITDGDNRATGKFLIK